MPRCLIGIEAGMATHYVARELSGLGHDVKQVPPAYSKPFRQDHKNDFRDTYAVAEAVQRPSTSCVPETKSAITQAQQEFTSGLVQNVRYPLSIMQEDQAMNTIKLTMAVLVAAGVAATPFAAQANKYRHLRHSISYQASTSGPYPTAGVTVPRNGGYGTSGTSVGTVTAPSIGTYNWPSVGVTNAVPTWSNTTPAVR